MIVDRGALDTSPMDRVGGISPVAELAGYSRSETSGYGMVLVPLMGQATSRTSGYGMVNIMPSTSRRDISYAVVGILSADAYINALVGGRIYRRRLPQGIDLPAISVTRIDAIRDRDTNTGRYATARVQCSVFDTNSGRCEDLSDLIADNLHRLVDTYATAGSSGVYVVRCMDAGDITDVNTDVNPEIYMNHRDFMIEYDYLR